MRGDLRKLHERTSMRNGGRRAGMGVIHDDCGDESLGRVVDKLVRAHQISAKIVPKTKPRKGRYKGV